MRTFLAFGLLCLAFLTGCGGNGTGINFDDIVGEWTVEMDPPVAGYTRMILDILPDGQVDGPVWSGSTPYEIHGEVDENGQFTGTIDLYEVTGTIRPYGTDQIEIDFEVDGERINVVMDRILYL